MNEEREVRLSDLIIPEFDAKQMQDGDLWVSFLGFSVHLIQTDEGIVVDVWPGDKTYFAVGDEPIATTYAFTSELEV